jgi:hypothetical protein
MSLLPGPTYSGKVRAWSWQFRKKIDQAAEHFEKSPDTLLNISKKSDEVDELFKKSSAKLSRFSQIVRQRYRSFQKKFVEVPGLSGKKEGPKHTIPRVIDQRTLPDFPGNGRQRYRTF